MLAYTKYINITDIEINPALFELFNLPSSEYPDHYNFDGIRIYGNKNIHTEHVTIHTTNTVRFFNYAQFTTPFTPDIEYEILCEF